VFVDIAQLVSSCCPTDYRESYVFNLFYSYDNAKITDPKYRLSTCNCIYYALTTMKRSKQANAFNLFTYTKRIYEVKSAGMDLLIYHSPE